MVQLPSARLWISVSVSRGVHVPPPFFPLHGSARVPKLTTCEREQVHEKGFCFGFAGLCTRVCVSYGDVLSGASPVDGQWIGFSFLIVLCAFSIWSCEKGYKRSSAAVHGEELG